MYFPLFGGLLYINIFVPACIILMAFSEGIISLLCLILPAVIHGAGHILFIKLALQHINRIVIEPFGGAICHTRKGLAEKSELFILSGGIIFNFASVLPAAILFDYSPNEYTLLFAISSAFYGIINILPAKGLDGYGIVYLFVSRRFEYEKCEKICGTISFISKTALMTIGFLILYASSFNNGLCIIFAIAAIPLT